MSSSYSLPDLDPAAPLDRHRAVVRPEWIDPNGHMNVAYYVLAFDQATDTFCEQLGVAWDYVAHKLGMVFALEAHVTYDREVRVDDPLRITTQLLGHDGKRVHFFHTMYHGNEGWLAATNELILLHVDFDTRRAAPWRDETLRRLETMTVAHGALPWPAKAGRQISLKSKAAATTRP